ncbi:MAG: class II aldolase/adducin family protein [Rhodospirillales bacterium]|nr:class II aldolase/adducin family protein [Rhodospirillales bacterium]
MKMADHVELIRDLVIANRILAREGVVDAFGHVSIRHPDNPDRYLMSCSRAPELVTADDIMEFTLDGEPVDARDRKPYGERPIHGGIYEMRPEVNSVVHNHAHEILPFGITNTPMRPVAHVCGPIGTDIPVWDIRDNFGETDHLVLTMEQGRDLAKTLGDNRVALMRGHGGVVSGGDLRQSVMTAVYLQVNAKLLLQSLQLGTPNYLTPTEIEKCTARQFHPLSLDRAWEYWRARAGGDSL